MHGVWFASGWCVGERVGPRPELFQVETRSGHGGGQRCGAQRELRRRDVVRREQLKHPFGGPNEAAGVVTQIDDQALGRQLCEELDGGLEEMLVVIDIETPDAKVAKRSVAGFYVSC